jgi:anti-sigma regulatory factor (Ser/Thr protein kinase)
VTSSATHDAVFFSTQEELVSSAAPFLRDGLDRGDQVVLICGDDNGSALARALDDDPRLTFIPRDRVYRRAPIALDVYQACAREGLQNGANGVRVAGEVGFVADGEPAWEEMVRFEAGMSDNADASLSSLCMYERRTIGRDALAGAEAMHRFQRQPAGRVEPERYVDPVDVLHKLTRQSADPVEATPPALAVDELTDLAMLRRRVREVLGDRSPTLPRDTMENFVVVVNELAGNAILHGAGGVRVRVWVTDDRAVCAVSDGGHGFLAPFTGVLPPRPESLATSGMGLYLVRELSDELDGYVSGSDFTVRAGIRLGSAPAGRPR